jgi:uncharacterized protein (TIGR00730 family)
MNLIRRMDKLEKEFKAYHNIEFLDSPQARPIRIISEYSYPEKVFTEEKVDKVIVFFGSARIQPLDSPNLTPIQKEMALYYEDARALAYKITNWTKTLQENEAFMLCSGGGPGIMEAANRGAYEAGGRSIGLNISLPFEQNPNPYITPKFNFEFHYFFMRKFWFANLLEAIVVFPGGFGTFDEFFEVLTLIQTEKMIKKRPIVLYGANFWNKVVNLDYLAEVGMISPDDLDLFKIVSSVEEAYEYIITELTETHKL